LELKNIHNIFFIGIGGIGMSALAKHFHAMGLCVSGYDRTNTLITQQLKDLGITVCFDEDLSHIPEKVDLVVYTPAVPKTQAHLQYFLNNSYPVKKRAEVLGMIAATHYTVAIAGTHGKTTTGSIVSHILKTAQSDFMAFLGGIAKNYNTNYITSGKPSVVVAEADEYDRSFLKLFPDIAIITALDADHLDIYGSHENMIESYNDFIAQISKQGSLIIQHEYKKCVKEMPSSCITYGMTKGSGFYASDIIVANGTYSFNIYNDTGVFIKDLRFNIGGRHNIENTVAAVVACHLLGVDTATIKKAIASYSGVYRRFDTRIKSEKLVFIDDYAHHPDELRAFIDSVRELYPEKKLTGIFQPHLFTRTRDFADGFAKVLSTLDEVILLEIYPARELPLEGVNAQMLLDKISIPQKKLCTKKELIDEVIGRNTDVILTIGAGDIDALVLPLEKSLLNMIQLM